MNFKNLFDISICSNINRELWCKDSFRISDIDYFGLVGAVENFLTIRPFCRILEILNDLL